MCTNENCGVWSHTDCLEKSDDTYVVSCAKLVYCNVDKLVTIILNTDMDVLLFVASL